MLWPNRLSQSYEILHEKMVDHVLSEDTKQNSSIKVSFVTVVIDGRVRHRNNSQNYGNTIVAMIDITLYLNRRVEGLHGINE